MILELRARSLIRFVIFLILVGVSNYLVLHSAQVYYDGYQKWRSHSTTPKNATFYLVHWRQMISSPKRSCYLLVEKKALKSLAMHIVDNLQKQKRQSFRYFALRATRYYVINIHIRYLHLHLSSQMTQFLPRHF